MKTLVRVLAVVTLVLVVPVVLAGRAGAEGQGASHVVDATVTVAGKPVIADALLEVAEGRPARLTVYGDEARTSGFELTLATAGVPAEAPAQVKSGAVFLEATVHRLEAGARLSLAEAVLGVRPGEPASVTLHRDRETVEVRLTLRGRHAPQVSGLSTR
ncbi:hypothetical protein [Vulcaniibacterium gelatinicum]|uniref:hypothetical protein n=1 Tax=Vulcaniibacterium gelatinicum TaxID=2598725 RepID=UPI0011CCA0A1|nr:hypothetical protein [Vulcaniibacterium gelatinicum]